MGRTGSAVLTFRSFEELSFSPWIYVLILRAFFEVLFVLDSFLFDLLVWFYNFDL